MALIYKMDNPRLVQRLQRKRTELPRSAWLAYIKQLKAQARAAAATR